MVVYFILLHHYKVFSLSLATTFVFFYFCLSDESINRSIFEYIIDEKACQAMSHHEEKL